MQLDNSFDIRGENRIIIERKISETSSELIYIYNTGTAIKFNVENEKYNATTYSLVPENIISSNMFLRI